MGKQESLCNDCIHYDVCALKDQFAAAQKATNEVYIKNEAGENAGIINLRDIPWIEPISLKCCHYAIKFFAEYRGDIGCCALNQD